MNKLFAIVLLAAVAVQGKYIPEIQDAIVRYPELLRQSRINVGAMSRDAADGKIIGGTAASPGQFPYQCHLSIRIGLNSYFCGCSVLSDTWILTAAHCPDGAAQDAVTVTLGDTNRNTNEGSEVTRTSIRHIIHEAWGSLRIINDIAVIEVSSFPLSADIAPICLAPASSGDFAGAPATVSGWGKTSDAGGVATQLYYVDVPVITNAECAQTYGSTIQPTNICTSTFGNKGTCNGDSGGPLVTDVNGSVKQIGIVSFGLASGCTDGPSAFSRVSSYIDWINTNVGAGVIC